MLVLMRFATGIPFSSGRAGCSLRHRVHRGQNVWVTPVPLHAPAGIADGVNGTRVRIERRLGLDDDIIAPRNDWASELARNASMRTDRLCISDLMLRRTLRESRYELNSKVFYFAGLDGRVFDA